MTKVLITGASSGIGKALSRQLAQDVSLLVLLGRNSEKLWDNKLELEYLFPHAQIDVVCCDFAQCNAGQLMELADKLWHRYISFDVLIFCAGVAHQEPFLETEAYRVEQQISVNLLAPISFTRAFGSLMIENSVRGNIVFVSSLMGRVAAPSFATYSATKFALVGFARALRKELYSAGISVSVILPTLTATPMVENFRNFAGVEVVSPEYVAQQAIRRGIHKKEKEVVIGWQAHGAIIAEKLFPEVVEKVMCTLNPCRTLPDEE